MRDPFHAASANAQGCLNVFVGRVILLLNHASHSINVLVSDCSYWATLTNFARERNVSPMELTVPSLYGAVGRCFIAKYALKFSCAFFAS